MVANWKLFKKWEIKEKEARLKSLSPEEGLAGFEELHLLQETLPPDELEKLHQRRLKELISQRGTMDSLKEKLG